MNRCIPCWLAIAAALLTLPAGARADLRPENLRCEYLVDPLGIDEKAPRLSWTLSSRRRGEVQTAYQILVASTPDDLRAGRAGLWDTGRVAGRQTAHVAYAGRALASGQACFWKVRVWGSDGKPSAYSAPASWEMGLLRPSDWDGTSWIGLASAGHRRRSTDAAGSGPRKGTPRAPPLQEPATSASGLTFRRESR